MAISQFPAPSGGGATLRTQTFTSSGSWTAPTGVFAVEVFAVGGGGGGGGGGTGTTRMGGGGGGGAAIYRMVSVTPGVTYTVTIGAGGSGGAPGANNGSNGGTTSFGSLVTAPGGGGGGHGDTGVGQDGACGGGNGTKHTNPYAPATGGGGMTAPGGAADVLTGAAFRVAGRASHGCPGGTSANNQLRDTMCTSGGAGINGFAGGGGAGTTRTSNYGDRQWGRGAHGGGDGAIRNQVPAQNGAVNTGGGGGGGMWYSGGAGSFGGGNGGSGYLRLMWWQT